MVKSYLVISLDFSFESACSTSYEFSTKHLSSYVTPIIPQDCSRVSLLDRQHNIGANVITACCRDFNAPQLRETCQNWNDSLKFSSFYEAKSVQNDISLKLFISIFNIQKRIMIFSRLISHIKPRKNLLIFVAHRHTVPKSPFQMAKFKRPHVPSWTPTLTP